MTKSAQIIHKYLLIAIIYTLIHGHAAAQNEQWYTSDGYLSSSLISDVLYDRDGILWVATEDCLNRFDGSKFTIYRNDPDDPHTIGNDRINDIFEDRDGRLFVCSHAGVQIYDRAADHFSEPLRVTQERRTSSPLSCIVQRSTGELWAVGNEIYRIVTADDGAVRLEHIDLPDNLRFVLRAAADADDNIWLSKHAQGLYCVTPKGEVRHYFGGHDDPVMTAFCVGPDRKLYAGSSKHGLYRYDTESDSFAKIELPHGYTDLSIASLQPDEYGNILVGTDGDGLKVYNPATGENRTFSFANINSGKLKIHGLVKDPVGNLWVGVYQKGLLKMPKPTAFFKSIDHRMGNIIGSCCVTAILRDSDGTLWVGTDNDDLYAVDLDNMTSRHYTINIPKTVMCLYEDSHGRLWLGSYNRGMGIVDKRTGAYTPMRLTHQGLDVSNVYDFAELPDGDMLVATMGAGLFRYNPATQTGEKVHIGAMGDWITCVQVAADGSVLAGSYDGVFFINPALTEGTGILRGKIVSAIHQEPRHGHVWVGTNEGLVCLTSQGEKVRTYTPADGLPSHAINAIERGDDALWISTNNGLTKFNVNRGEFCNFNVNHGLPHNEFYRNASYKDTDGNIYFGGINGIASLHTSNIEVPSEKLTLRVTDFLLGDRSVNATTRSGRRQVIDCPITEATTFRLSHDDNSFSIVVNAKELVNTGHTEYYYSFDGSDWTRIYNSQRNMGGVTLTFSNVDSGSHRLLVKAVNAGAESDTLALDIDIDTVWYATWWAYMLYALLLGLLLWQSYRQLRRRISERRQAEERRHKAEILEAKLQFFTNISHEIRTPLSLVIGPLQKLQASESDPAKSDTYRVVLRNANRILRLVNELMDLRKIDNKQMTMRYTETAMVPFVDELFENFKQAAQAKNIDFEFHHQGCDDLKAWIDVTNFDKVVVNLLSNAIKFTPDNGRVTVDMRHGTDTSVDGPLRDYVEISVTDTGIGISEEDRKSIFNRFYQASNNTVGGTGIGLHLTREFVTLHNGVIYIEDNPEGAGTRFVVRIPAGADHLNPEEICLESSRPVVTESARQEALPVDVPVNEDTAHKPKPPRGTDMVYVVEDDEEILNYLVTNLSAHFRTYGFNNGKLALEKIHECPPSLVITDVMMPEMDGYTLTRKIKQNIKLNHIPVIILTAKTREEDNIDAIDSGAAVYLTKPFNIDVLIKTAAHLMKSVARMRNALSGQQSQEDKLENIEVMSNDDKLMMRVMRVINRNLSNSDITVEMIAREIGISRVHLHRKLKEITNQSTRDFIRNIRLQAAAKLMREKKLTVAEVSDLVGFKQANNFSTVFKEMFGMTPTAYTAKYHPDSTTEIPDIPA